MELKNLKVTECYESEFNPRGKKFDGPAFEELVESVKEKGVLVPVLARKKGKGYEIIAGARRFRAATIAECTEIPANVVEMNDTEALEAQIIENLQRQDIHPIEEGTAYRKLLEETKGYDIATIAAKVGKSKPYIRQRLSLTELTPAAQKALQDGDMNIGQAVLIARVPEKMQAAVLKECVRYDYEPERIRRFIQEHMTAELSKNPLWGKGTEAEKAISAAVDPCEECPKSIDLFGKNASLVCPNPTCYARRMAAWITQKKREFEANGEPLSLVSSSYNTSHIKGVLGSGEYRKVPITERKGSDHVHMALVVEGYEDVGKVIAICTAKNCKNKKHNPYYSAPYKPSAKELERRKKEEEKEQKAEKKSAAAKKAALAKIKWPITERHLDALFELVIEDEYHGFSDVAKERGLSLPKGKKDYDSDAWRDLLLPTVKTSTDKIRLIFELKLARSGYIDEDVEKKVLKMIV